MISRKIETDLEGRLDTIDCCMRLIYHDKAATRRVQRLLDTTMIGHAGARRRGGEGDRQEKRKPPSLLCSFGMIADIQYADVDDGYNFQKTVRRRFR